MAIYVFQPKENESGIPGLPHEVSDEEAEALGVKDVLLEAIRAGKYTEKKPAKGSKE